MRRKLSKEKMKEIEKEIIKVYTKMEGLTLNQIQNLEFRMLWVL